MRILLVALAILTVRTALPCSCNRDPLTKRLKGALVVVGKTGTMKNDRVPFDVIRTLKGNAPST